MKLIFLDIDGVLATEESSKQENHPLYSYPFDKKCVSILNEILKKTNAEIILSSDWRIMYNNDLEVLDELFKFNQIVKSPIDVTPNLGRNREAEILLYVQENVKEKIEFVILDDCDLKIYPNNFVKCNISKGLNDADMKEKIISILNGENK